MLLSSLLDDQTKAAAIQVPPLLDLFVAQIEGGFEYGTWAAVSHECRITQKAHILTRLTGGLKPYLAAISEYL